MNGLLDQSTPARKKQTRKNFFYLFLNEGRYISKMNKAVFGSRKSIFRKYFIFRKCYFSERKMFLCLWLYFKKYFLVFGKCYKEKDKTRKTNTAPKLTLAFDWLWRRSTAIDGVRRREASIAISRRRDRDQRRDLTMARSRSTLLLSRARALSLSLSFSGNALKGK